MPSPEPFISIFNRTREDILRDYAGGQSVGVIAGRIGCSPTLLNDWLHATGVMLRRRGPVKGTKRKAQTAYLPPEVEPL